MSSTNPRACLVPNIDLEVRSRRKHVLDIGPYMGTTNNEHPIKNEWTWKTARNTKK